MTEINASNNIPSSYRDPSGCLFYKDNLIYRKVNKIYKDNYDMLMGSGLYDALVKDALLIPHEEVDIDCEKPDNAYKIIKPQKIPFISYPYEWCFSQLKNAALTTLEIQKKALNFGMSLKDASAYNIQFRNCKTVLIDTLSFEKYQEGNPWVAYRQFCQHFLAPLALAHYKDIRLNQLLKIYMDGLPLDLVSILLPFRTRFIFHLCTHIHLHAKSQKYFSDKTINMNKHKMKRFALLGLIDSLELSVRKLKWQSEKSQWTEYYEDTNYSSGAFQHKKQLISEFLEKINPSNIWDLGANIGEFSRIAGKKGVPTISFDIDPACVEKNYLECVGSGTTNILPLLLDLTNPSPSIGWENAERSSLIERGPADTILALALVHHLAISNNVPFNRIAYFFKKICKSLIIEFIPKDDSMAQKLLRAREDIFHDYTKEAFENAFGSYFAIQNSSTIRDSERTLYLMRRK